MIEPRNEEERARMDRDLGGVVIEVHCCPACGKVEARPAS
jgi:hypothetical protein